MTTGFCKDSFSQSIFCLVVAAPAVGTQVAVYILRTCSNFFESTKYTFYMRLTVVRYFDPCISRSFFGSLPKMEYENRSNLRQMCHISFSLI